MYNTYSKTVAFLEVVENLSAVEARESLKRYFDMLIADLDLSGVERAVDEGPLEEDLRHQASYSLSIKNLKWRMVSLGIRIPIGNPADYLTMPDVRENVSDKLETILSKNKFFDREELCVPSRLCVMGGSQELQLMCQNLGTLFEVI